MTADEFLIKWRKENNTPLAVYSSYHIDAMEAYHKHKVESISDKDIEHGCRENSREDFFKYGSSAKFTKGAEWFKNRLLELTIENGSK